ncbi:unannotated protein [freshwater metagenome]|uniref:Unannotated protein n=1 Tax=freshwater metagenome TaxID=449393 RepID=A0A6J7RM82_9ZZZZ
MSFLEPALRTAVSFVPSPSLIRLRELRDLPALIRRVPHEPDFLALRFWKVNEPVILDVGANRGQSLRSFRYVIHDPWVHCVEPNPFLASHLRKAHNGDPRVQVHQLAASDSAGEFDLYLPRYGHTVYDTRAALGPVAPEAFLSSEFFMGFRPDRAAVERVKVRVMTLDELSIEPKLVKIDVEGADDRVIAGSSQLLRRFRPLVLVELPQPATVDLLTGLGYAPFAFEQPRRLIEGGRGELNTYFLLAEHREQFDLVVD